MYYPGVPWGHDIAIVHFCQQDLDKTPLPWSYWADALSKKNYDHSLVLIKRQPHSSKEVGFFIEILLFHRNPIRLLYYDPEGPQGGA